MRVPLVLSLGCCAATLGCGNGVGHPLVESEAKSSTPQAGSGGRSGWDGTSSYGGSQPFAGRGSMWDGPGRGAPDGEVPDSDDCASVADWPVESSEGELTLFALLNAGREYGELCAPDSTTGPARPVTMKPELRCAARLHARDMSQRGFFDHVNPDGVGPEDRMRRAGYVSFRVAGESIARGSAFGGTDPVSAFVGFLNEGDAECQNLIDPAFDAVGVGRFGDYLTLDFAGP